MDIKRYDGILPPWLASRQGGRVTNRSRAGDERAAG
jgi:hypothetical protein